MPNLTGKSSRREKVMDGLRYQLTRTFSRDGASEEARCYEQALAALEGQTDEEYNQYAAEAGLDWWPDA